MLGSSTISLESFFVNAYKKSTISNERKSLLFKISQAIAKEYRLNNEVHLHFICTDNSRRSQLGQVWSFYAAHYFKLNINAFSGGTEVTAFFRNTIKTLQKVGFEFQLSNFSHQNPTYQISFSGTKKSILGFSKFYSNPINKEPFIAITTSKNDAINCPSSPNSIHCFHLPFKDPKPADGTSEQEETYLQISKQIAAEIYVIFSDVKRLV
jgi:arsenate reductase